MAQNDIQTLIEQFANQIQAAAKRSALAEILAKLGGGGGEVPGPFRTGKRRGRPKGSKNVAKAAPAVASAAPAAAPAIMRVRKGKRRSAEDVSAMGTTLIDYVKANPGQRADQIAKALRTDPNTMRLPMQALLASKKVKTQGQRRGTKYYVAGAVPAAAPKAKAKPAKKKARKARGKKK